MNVIKVEFNEKNQASFDIEGVGPEGIVTAILGLHQYLEHHTGLDREEIRKMIDDTESKTDTKAKS